MISRPVYYHLRLHSHREFLFSWYWSEPRNKGKPESKRIDWPIVPPRQRIGIIKKDNMMPMNAPIRAGPMLI